MIGASRGKVIGRRNPHKRGDQLPIGELDANIFNCPRCARPLSVGTSRCSGCGSRLVAGVRLGRAIGFVAIGVIIGSALGGGAMAVVTVVNRPATVAGVVTPPVVTPSTAPIATAKAVDPSVRPVPVDPAVPTAALSALRRSVVVNQRMLADADRLAAILKVKWPTGKAVAPVLRSLAATAALGDQLAPDIATWSDGEQLSQDYVTFYAAIGGAADDGLAASLSNNRAYVNAGNRTMKIIAGMAALDATSRKLAATADVELPPLEPTP